MIFYFCLLYEIESVYGQAAYGSRLQQNWNVPRVTSLEKLPPFKSNDIIGEEKGSNVKFANFSANFQRILAVLAIEPFQSWNH